MAWLQWPQERELVNARNNRFERCQQYIIGSELQKIRTNHHIQARLLRIGSCRPFGNLPGLVSEYYRSTRHPPVATNRLQH